MRETYQEKTKQLYASNCTNMKRKDSIIHIGYIRIKDKQSIEIFGCK